MIRRLEQFYAAFGDRGVMFILYAFSVVVNTLLTWSMQLPAVFPDEISVAGVAAFYSGRDWSALLAPIGGGHGYVQALLYAPLFIMLKNPYAVYKAMLIANGILVSFIPLIAYHMAAKLGVVRVRQKLLIALSCGMYVAYIVNSKYVWNEAITSLLGWVLALCVFNAWDRKNRYTRFTTSLLSGFMCAVAYAANERLIAVVAAVILTVIIARVFFREKLVNIPIFTVSLAVSFTAEYFARQTVTQAVWNGARKAPDGISATADIFGKFFSLIYAFMTSTLGMGALAAALFIVMILAWIKEGIKNSEKTLEDGTKVYDPAGHKYNLRLTIFALFQFLAVGCATLFSALTSRTESVLASEAAVFGRETDNIAPLALFLVLVFVFLYGIDLKKLFIGTGIYAYACVCFVLVGYRTVCRSGEYLESALTGLLPLKLSGEAVGEFAGMNYIIMSSCVFAMLALLIVFASCSRKHRTLLASAAIFCVIVYTTSYAGIIYLPETGAENAEETEPFKRVSELLYNNPQSPPVVAFETDPALAATVQFLSPDVRVSILKTGAKIPESCLLIAESGVEAPLEGGSYDVVGRTDKFTVYAYGESARNFIKYSAESEK